MTDGQPSRLGHVGRRKEIDVGADFDLLAHQAGWRDCVRPSVRAAA